MQCAAHKDLAAGGAVGDLEFLVRAKERYGVYAGDRAAAQRVHADFIGAAFAHVALTAVDGRHFSPGIHRVTQHQCGAAGRVHFLIVMDFRDLHIKVRTENFGDLPQNTLEYGGKFFVCGTGRQPILRNKMENDNYYLLTLAAIAKEIKQRGGKTECSVRIAAGLPLAGFGREKKPFREYLLRSSQLADGLRPVCFQFEGIAYKITIEDVKLFPQGYSAIALHPELIQNEPSVLLMDIGGWTVDLMRLDNGVPNAATCRSLELGMIRCIDEMKEQVRRDTGLSVTDAQVERVLAGKSCSMDEDARNIIQKQGRLYTERLLSAAMESGFDLKAIPVVMLGGGAAVVKRNVAPQDGLCRVFALLDDRVNAEGFERILGRLSGGVGIG